MKLLLTVLLAILPMPGLRADEVTVRRGTVSIQVPVPEGFVQIPPSHPGFQQTQSVMLAGGFDLLALFLPPPRPDGSFDLARQFSVQVQKDISEQHMSKAEFDIAARGLETRRASMDPSPTAPFRFEPAYDSGNCYLSALCRMHSADGGETCAVQTTALVRGLTWFLVCASSSATAQDVAWVKDSSRKWVAAILAASPSDPATLEKENAPLPPSINLYVKRFVQMAVIFLLFLAIYKMVRKRQQKPF